MSCVKKYCFTESWFCLQNTDGVLSFFVLWEFDFECRSSVFSGQLWSVRVFIKVHCRQIQPEILCGHRYQKWFFLLLLLLSTLFLTSLKSFLFTCITSHGRRTPHSLAQTSESGCGTPRQQMSDGLG